ncbi:hypothetical protein DH2020_035879 [Rehmannia glutinosa]|uniref:Peroxidase n=1 Tax=Rehmannia glutinosa TaxID=99300 RepID=A0ABR0V562_REHGL
MSKVSYIFLLCLCFLSLGLCNGGELRKNFYRTSCPQAEQIVRDITRKNVATNAALPAKLLRMHFHDCFVRVKNLLLFFCQGCDGSVLIDSTANNTAEKDTIPNRSLAGFDVIDEIKTQLEKTCPGKVSCADIVALSARDSVSVQNRTMWEVLTGRRDGKISRASEALADIPSPFSNFTILRQSFANKSLTVKDLVVLSGTKLLWFKYIGAHTIGVGHCNFFSNRLYNFTGKGDADPSLNATYAATLRSKCRNLSDNTTTVEMDPGSSLTFDNHYFPTLKLQQGLFQSDAALLTNNVANDPTSARIVTEFQSQAAFLEQFGKSMVKMGGIEVLVGDEGEIRKNCRVVN